jgi:hypothetical protein
MVVRVSLSSLGLHGSRLLAYFDRTRMDILLGFDIMRRYVGVDVDYQHIAISACGRIV